MKLELNKSTSKVIETGTVLGIIILAVGLLLNGYGFGSDILMAGTVILVLTPAAGIITSLVCLLDAGDRRWAAVGAILILVVAIGLALSLLEV